MKKRFLTASLATMMVLSLAACGGGKAADTTTAPAATEAPADTKAEDKAEETKAEETKAEAEAAGEKAPEDYKGTVVVYSPHDADPLNAGVNLFMEKYPNVKVEVVAAGTGELCNRIAAETANPIADVLWGGGADSLAAFKEYFEPYVCANDEFIGCRLPRYLTKPRQRRNEWDMAGSDGISRVSAVFRGKLLLTNKMRII